MLIDAEKEHKLLRDQLKMTQDNNLVGLRTIFEEIDTKHSGYISLQQLHEFLKVHGVTMSERDVNLVVKVFDRNKD